MIDIDNMPPKAVKRTMIRLIVVSVILFPFSILGFVAGMIWHSLHMGFAAFEFLMEVGPQDE